MSREFFGTHEPRAAREHIRCLRAQDVNLHTVPKEVMRIVTDYYRELFQQQEHLHPRATRCKEQVWSHIPTVVSPRK